MYGYFIESFLYKDALDVGHDQSKRLVRDRGERSRATRGQKYNFSPIFKFKNKKVDIIYDIRCDKVIRL